MVTIGSVEPFPNRVPDKEQMMKIVEETMEVYSAWEKLQAYPETYTDMNSFVRNNYLKTHMLNECADLIMAITNMVSALGVENFEPYMKHCEAVQRERGRYDEQQIQR